MLPRVGIPVAFAVLYYVITRWPVGGDPANVAGVMDMVAAGLAAHWYYAQWRKGLGAKQFRLARWAGTFIWLGVFIWIAVQFVACMMSIGLTRSYGSWAELSASYMAALTSAGVWGVLVFAALVRLVEKLWEWQRERLEPTEALWWADYLVTFAVYFLRVLVALSVAAVVSTLLAPGFGYHVLYEGSWLNGTLVFLRQLAEAGTLTMLLLAAAFRMVSARCRLWIEVREKREGVGDLVCMWGKRLLRVVEVLAYGTFALGLIGSVVALIYPEAGPTGFGWAMLIAQGFLPTSLVLPVLGIVALCYAWLAYRWWRDAPGRAWSMAAASGPVFSRPSKPPKRPFILRALVWLLAATALAGLVFLVLLALNDMLLAVKYGVGPAAVAQAICSSVSAGLAEPNIWGMLAIVVWQIVVIIAILIVGLIVLGLFLGGDGAGGGGAVSYTHLTLPTTPYV